MKIDPRKLRLDGGTQSREKIDTDLVAEYAALMKAGVVFPPVDVFYDGQEIWVADGFHRTLAAIKARRKIEIESYQGVCRDAILWSCGANASHGIKRTNAEKQRAVLLMLNDEEWGQWSDIRIANRCKVDEKTVAKYRESISGNSGDAQEIDDRSVTSGSIDVGTPRKAIRNGKEYTIDPTNIGKARKPKTEPIADPSFDVEFVPSPDQTDAGIFDIESINWADYDADEPASDFHDQSELQPSTSVVGDFEAKMRTIARWFEQSTDHELFVGMLRDLTNDLAERSAVLAKRAVPIEALTS